MQTVSSAFTAEEKDSVRKIAQSLQVSWKKETNLSQRTFTIGVSTIGGNDIIGISPGTVGGPGIYDYFDESNYVTSLAWESGLNLPTGGLTKGLAEAHLDNTSGRFTPRYMGGNSELFTAILPRRPFIINAGFNYGGIDNLIPQFAGVVTKQPQVDKRNGSVVLSGADYIDFFEGRQLDKSAMFTGLRTDEVLESLFSQLGMATSQYSLDTGINIIPFGVFEKDAKFSQVIHQLAEAENGHVYQDEEGRIRFENRQHWDSSPYNSVQRIILTGQVINAEAPSEDHIINQVNIKVTQRSKQPLQVVFRLATLDSIQVLPGVTKEVFVNFEDPILSLTTPTASSGDSYFVAVDTNLNDVSSSLSVTRIDQFSQSAKLLFTNSGSVIANITELVLSGRPAKVVRDVYYRDKDSSSITAFEERPLSIENPFIQDEDWAASYARMILNDFSDIENLQIITIRAIPSLQKGDLISWQGRYWRVFNIKTTLDPSVGFVQELKLLQRTITTYFRIGISTIGGADRIAP